MTLIGDDMLTVDLINGTQLDQSSYVLATVPGGAIDGDFTNWDIPAGYAIDYDQGATSQLLLVAVIPEPGGIGLILTSIGIFSTLAASRRLRSQIVA